MYPTNSPAARSAGSDAALSPSSFGPALTAAAAAAGASGLLTRFSSSSSSGVRVPSESYRGCRRSTKKPASAPSHTASSSPYASAIPCCADVNSCIFSSVTDTR